MTIEKENERENVINKMCEIAFALASDYDRELENKIWRTCSDWNDKNPDCQIFLCNLDNGIGIEDDVFYFND